MDFLIFIALMALGQFSPGPDMLLLTRTALRAGFPTALRMIAGIATGLGLHAGLAIIGLSQLFRQESTLATVLKITAALYLIWLALGLLRELFIARYSGTKIELDPAPAHVRSPYLQGLLCNVTNAKALLFFAGLLTPFLSGPRPAWWPFALWLTVVLEALILWSLGAKLRHNTAVNRFYFQRALFIDGGFGLALLVLALVFLASLF
ncbi:MAG: LysE family transporter [Verrucomicrobiales bacterium]